jgi:hypothetical protein
MVDCKWNEIVMVMLNFLEGLAIILTKVTTFDPKGVDELYLSSSKTNT